MNVCLPKRMSVNTARLVCWVPDANMVPLGLTRSVGRTAEDRVKVCHMSVLGN